MKALLSVDWGIVFWTGTAFIIVFLLLKKFAWTSILKALDERAIGIENALNEAESAKKEMAKLKAGSEALLREAREERDVILREAKTMKDNIVADAKNKAQEESTRLIEAARLEIDNQKKAAMTELKNYVANLSIDVAEKVLREKLSDADKQSALNSKLLSDISKN
jgi:F-type H+-transporting ATPase subunit b